MKAFTSKYERMSSTLIIFRIYTQQIVMVSKVRASHILVEKHSQAMKVLEDLKAGKDFSKLARQFSNCPSGKRGGDLGFFGRGRMIKEFDKTAFTLKVGEVSGPIKTQFGYHIIKKTAEK